MHRQSGITLVELLIVVAIASLMLGVTASYSIPMLARENMRSAVYDAQTYMQLARIEAVSRNRDCSFRVNTGTRTLRVLDTMGTSSTGDDAVLYEKSLPEAVSFSRPDSGTAVTLTDVGSGEYETVFSSDGTVRSGTGEVVVFGGNQYRKLAVYGAGGLRIERWTGTAWTAGS